MCPDLWNTLDASVSCFHALIFAGVRGRCLNMRRQPSVQTLPRDPANDKAVTHTNMFDHYCCIYDSIKNTGRKFLGKNKTKHKSVTHSVLCIMASFREKRNDFYAYYNDDKNVMFEH